MANGPGRGSLTRILALCASLVAPAAPPLSAAPSPYTPSGNLVRSGDDLLHMLCTGDGAPTIVLESGAGGNHLDWSLVQPKLARTNRVCSYDRAGIGWSAGRGRPRTVDNIADELHRAVAAAGIARPFVLAGHSFGGLIALHYARRYPGEVAGLVLLDSMHPEQFGRFRSAGVRLPDPQVVALHTPTTAATYGLPRELHGLAVYLAGRSEARRSTVAEMASLAANAETVRAEGPPQIAARIVIHGNQEWDALYPDGRMENAWADMQSALAEQLGAPPPIVAPSSGHQIALDSPDLVVATIRGLAGSSLVARHGP